MSVKKLILIISIFYSLLIMGAPQSFAYRFGESSIEDVKERYEILEAEPFGDGTLYIINDSYLSNVWCDSNGFVGGMKYLDIKFGFEETVMMLADRNKLLGRVPTDISSLKRNVKFKGDNCEVFIHSFKESLYHATYFMSEGYKKELLKRKYIVDF